MSAFRQFDDMAGHERFHWEHVLNEFPSGVSVRIFNDFAFADYGLSGAFHPMNLPPEHLKRKKHERRRSS